MLENQEMRETQPTIEELSALLEMERTEKERLKFLSEVNETLELKGLPKEMAHILMGDTSEETFKNIEVFEQCFLNALKKEVESRLAGVSPEAGRVFVNADPSKMSDKEYYSYMLSKNKNYK